MKFILILYAFMIDGSMEVRNFEVQSKEACEVVSREHLREFIKDIKKDGVAYAAGHICTPKDEQ